MAHGLVLLPKLLPMIGTACSRFLFAVILNSFIATIAGLTFLSYTPPQAARPSSYP